MASSYSVTLSMNAATLNSLTNSGFSLYAFKAVKSSNGSGLPTVWFQSQALGSQTDISWQEQYTAFTSKQQLIAGATISGYNPFPIDLGQRLSVDQKSGSGDVVDGTNADAIEINNTSGVQMVCGIGQVNPDGKSAKLCAFPLYGQELNVIAPIEKIVLMFATTALNTGTVIEQSYGPAVQLDLTAHGSGTVSYDINTGWAAGSLPSTIIPASTSLVPFLIES